MKLSFFWNLEHHLYKTMSVWSVGISEPTETKSHLLQIFILKSAFKYIIRRKKNVIESLNLAKVIFLLRLSLFVDNQIVVS